MKFYGPDKSLLIDIEAVKPHPEGIVIEGKIMGAMPMKAVLRPGELRGAFGLLSWGLVFRIMKMFLGGKSFAPAKKGK